MTRIGILSDTHGYMDDRIVAHLSNCDEVWHAGDIGDASILPPLSENAVLRAVHGNIDSSSVRKVYPEWQIFKVEDITVCMTHIAGTPGRYSAETIRTITTHQADMLVCGHSHICMIKRDPTTNVLHINPGAAGRHGFHKVRTLVRLSVVGKKIENLEVVELGRRSTA